jgi:hypothetical protein
MKICTICLKIFEDENKICCGKELTHIIKHSTGTVFVGSDEPDWQYVKYYYVDTDIPHSDPKGR